MIALPPRDDLVVYIPVWDRWAGWEPRHWLLVRSASVFAYYSGLILCGSDADKEHIWRVAITKFVVFALVSFGAAAGNGVSCRRWPACISLLIARWCWHRCLTVWPAGKMTWASYKLCLTRYLTLCWAMSRSVVEKRSIDPALISKIHFFSIDRVQGR